MDMEKEMKTVTFFPRPFNGGGNPYIEDYVKALEDSGSKVVNPPSKNPLLSILPPARWGGTVIVNWPENIPDAPYGWLQSITYIVLLIVWRLTGRKVIWMIHNKKSHSESGHDWLKRQLTKLTFHLCSYRVSHAEEGITMYASAPGRIARSFHIIHPTKNRMDLRPQWADTQEPEYDYDVLIWGQVSEYKGVPQFLHYLADAGIDTLRVLVVGKCATPELQHRIESLKAPWLTYICKRASFEDLAVYAAKSRFVLCPYKPESVLCSAMLMDSLSWGSKVIGPDTGAFKDLSLDGEKYGVKVYVFKSLSDIPALVKEHGDEKISVEGYNRFLDGNDWPHYIQRLKQVVCCRRESCR